MTNEHWLSLLIGFLFMATLGLGLWRRRARLFLAQARRHLARNESEAAIRLLQATLALEPELDLAHFQMGRGYFQQANFPAALQHFEKALALNPAQAALLHYNLGLCHAAMADPKKAIQAFSANLELEPQHAKAHWHCGEQWFVLGERAKAKAAAQKALALDGQLQQAQALLARLS